MKAVDTTALVLVVIGGLNWGLIGFFEYNLVESAFGAGSVLTRLIYAVIGVAALWTISTMIMGMTKKEE